jgi:tetratricopeptide (TPR) repeat protein
MRRFFSSSLFVRFLLSAALLACSACFTCAAPATLPAGMEIPPAAMAGLDKLYAGNPDGALEEFRALEQAQPDHPLGYMLEGEARWWNIFCSTAEFKFGMVEIWRRPKLHEDQAYFDVAQKVIALAEARLARGESAEMHFYSAMGESLAARLYGLRLERGNAARSGVRAREHFLRALALEPNFADADLGIGLYNYYVDTLSAMARILRFFMGIPGGNKEEGIRQLRRAMTEGTLARVEARFYLARDLRLYDRDYERALVVLAPLNEQYPANPFFALYRGDLLAKLARKEQAAVWYRKAAALDPRNPEWRRKTHELAAAALAALGPEYALSAPASH